MFIEEPAPSPERQALYQEDLDDEGFVMNLTRAWAWVPEVSSGLFALLRAVAGAGDLSTRDRSILVTAMASTLGDAYCSLVWGARLAEITDPQTTVALIRNGSADPMSARDTALAAWARKMVSDPNATTQEDVDSLRSAGMSDGQIVATTVYTALRLAFSTVNDALGIAPDREVAVAAPRQVANAIDYGRTPDPVPSTGR